MRRRPRHLSAEERALWGQIADRVQPLSPQKADPKAVLTPKSKARPQTKSIPIEPFDMGQGPAPPRRDNLQPTLSDTLSSAPLNMDAKSFTRLKRGKLKPEGRIDLHGMTLEQAHGALLNFILTAHEADKRLVLVITGKGKSRDDGGPIPTRFGVLRHQVPQWLRLAPLARAVLQVSEAHLRHGGQGAYYVYLKRRR